MGYRCHLCRASRLSVALPGVRGLGRDGTAALSAVTVGDPNAAGRGGRASGRDADGWRVVDVAVVVGDNSQ